MLASWPAPRRVVLVAGPALLALAAVLVVLTLGGTPAPPAAHGQPSGLPAVQSDSPSPSATAPDTPSPSPGPSTASPKPTADRSPRPTGPPPPVSYEAETAGNVLRSGARVDQFAAASGGLAVFSIGGSNQGTLRFTRVAAPSSGMFTMTVFYVNPDRHDRIAHITVNGSDTASVRFQPTRDGVGSRTVQITLTGGTANTVEFANPDSRAPDIDRIVISTN